MFNIHERAYLLKQYYLNMAHRQLRKDFMIRYALSLNSLAKNPAHEDELIKSCIKSFDEYEEKQARDLGLV